METTVKQSSSIRVLKVGKTTNVNALSKVVVKSLLDEEFVWLDAIGVEPNYVAIKALIAITEELKTKGFKLEIMPTYHKLRTTSNQKKTAIRWLLSVKPK